MMRPSGAPNNQSRIKGMLEYAPFRLGPHGFAGPRV